MTTIDSDDPLNVEIFFTLLRPSSFVKYWYDEDGILHQRVISEEEWRVPVIEGTK